MSTASNPHGEPLPAPPGLISDVATFTYAGAPYPNPEIALSGAIAYLAGICGNAYNVSGTGLNQYIFMLAPTGVGKEAVAIAISRLNLAVVERTENPAITDYIGPSQIPSLPGLLKYLGRRDCPSMLCILPEVGYLLKTMTGRKADAHALGVQRGLLDLYGKSGKGQVVGSTAYSDQDKVQKPIMAPALSIFGEGTPETFYASLERETVANGFVPRCLLFETRTPRPYENKNRQVTPPPALVDSLAVLVGHTSKLSSKGEVCNVILSPEAEADLSSFSNWATDQINTGTEVTRQLWNRAHLKALKLAALSAVGRSPFTPVIMWDDCRWALDLVYRQTLHLIAKFETGETGEEAGDEVKQENIILRIIYEYMTEPFERFAKSGATRAMHQNKVIPHSYLSRRVLKLDAFSKDPRGATAALHRTLKNMMDAYELTELNSDQKTKEYQTRARLFVVPNPERIIDAGRRKYEGGV